MGLLHINNKKPKHLLPKWYIPVDLPIPDAEEINTSTKTNARSQFHCQVGYYQHMYKYFSYFWLLQWQLYPENEGFLIAVQDQVIATKNYTYYCILLWHHYQISNRFHKIVLFLKYFIPTDEHPVFLQKLSLLIKSTVHAELTLFSGSSTKQREFWGAEGEVALLVELASRSSCCMCPNINPSVSDMASVTGLWDRLKLQSHHFMIGGQRARRISNYKARYILTYVNRQIGFCSLYHALWMFIYCFIN